MRDLTSAPSVMGLTAAMQAQPVIGRQSPLEVEQLMRMLPTKVEGWPTLILQKRLPRKLKKRLNKNRP